MGLSAHRLSLVSMVRTNDTLVVTAERGAGNMSAADRVKDLLTSDHDGAFKEKEAAASKARMQWQPTPAEFSESVNHVHGIGHGPTVPAAPGGFGYVAAPSEPRFASHSNAPPPETQVKMDGPASLTKDWRTENSRIGRYWASPTFQLKPNGTWGFDKAVEGESNAFNSRLGLFN